MTKQKEWMIHVWGGAWNHDASPSIEKDYGINLKIATWAGKEKEVYLLSLMNICLEKSQIVLQKIH